jgi:hypothetical protein
MKDNALYHKGQCGLHCELMRVNAVRTGSMLLEPDQCKYQYGIEIYVKNLNMTKTFLRRIVFLESSGIDTCYNAGLYGWNRVDKVLILYWSGSKSSCVWLYSRNADLIASCFDSCGPASNSWLTCTDPCRPAAANINEKFVKFGQTRVHPQLLLPTHMPFSYPRGQLLNPYIKTVSSRFQPASMQITIFPGLFRLIFTPIKYGSWPSCVWL